jgi:hypothetical protein
MTTAYPGEERIARATLTYLAEPADPILCGLLRGTQPGPGPGLHPLRYCCWTLTWPCQNPAGG